MAETLADKSHRWIEARELCGSYTRGQRYRSYGVPQSDHGIGRLADRSAGLPTQEEFSPGTQLCYFWQALRPLPIKWAQKELVADG
jgi:hypothetical protein